MNRIIFALAFLVVAQSLLSQPSLLKLKETRQSNTPGVSPAFKVELNPKLNTQATVRFSKTASITRANARQWLATQLQFRTAIDDMHSTGKPLTTKSHLEIEKLQQFYKGLKVEYGNVSVMSSKGRLRVMQLEFYSIADNFVTTPAVSEATALSRALQHIGAIKYVWEGYTGTEEKYLLPKGELVIVQDRKASGTMKLVFKFNIYAANPMSYTSVYVDALNGSILFADNLINHANANGSGNTRYSGEQQNVTTDDESIESGKPYRLQALKYDFRHNIVTLNYGGNRTDNVANNALASDFADDDNSWKEYNDADSYTPNSFRTGFDVHFNMQVISDYWLNKHGRDSYDNNRGEMKNYVHATLVFSGAVDNNNAFWSSAEKAMFYGDGNFSRTNPTGKFPVTSLDICAHELGHAICDALVGGGAGLTYQGESGALDEGFSDIWGACIEKYFNDRFINVPAKNYWRIGEEISPDGIGFRDYINPKLKSNPDTYNKTFWKPTAPGSADRGGVHSNSSILYKWFSLITEGGSGTNDNGLDYGITGFGFDKSEMLAYALESMLPPNADYTTAKDASIDVALQLVEQAEFSDADVRVIKDAWRAVGVGDNFEVFDMTNAPAFTTNDFAVIAVGAQGHVWAGTKKNGLYKYNGSIWEQTPTAISDYSITGMVTDKKGGIWISESGQELDLHAGGGVFYYPTASFDTKSFFTQTEGIATRNAQSIFVDTGFTASPLPRVWVACLAENEPDETIRKGGIAYGLNANNTFTSIRGDITKPEGGCETIGGNQTEIWAFAKNNNVGGQSQLLRYDANTTILNGAYGNVNVPQLDNSFIANSICFDSRGHKWVGMVSNGMVMLDSVSVWHNINFPAIFPPPVIIQKNAVASDAKGNVFIGSDSGLVWYNGNGFLNAANYKRFTVKDGLPSNTVNGIHVDTLRGGIWLSTEKGIAFMRTPDSKTISVTVTQTTCPNQVVIKFTSSGSFYNDPAPNKFTVTLSDGFGSFNNPLVLDNITASPNGTVNFTITKPFPANLPVGTRYLVQVKSSNPNVVGTSAALMPFLITVPTTAGAGTKNADRECTTPDGWTNYYDRRGTPANTLDDLLLLSIKKNGNAIGTVGSDMDVTVATIANAGTNNATSVSGPLVITPYWSMNRYWNVFVIAANQPATDVGVRFYYNDQDLNDVNGSIPGNPVDHTKLVLYKTDGNPDPSTNFANATYIHGIFHENGLNIPGFTWKHTSLGDGKHMAEFEVSSFSGGGGGMTLTGGPLSYTEVFSIAAGNWSNPSVWSTGAVPNATSRVNIKHQIFMDINAECKSLKAVSPGILNVNSSKTLNIKN